MKDENLTTLARLSPLQEKATAESNRQYQSGFEPCEAAVGSEAALATKTFGQLDSTLVESGPCCDD